MHIIPHRASPGKAWATSALAILVLMSRSGSVRALMIVAVLALLSAVFDLPLEGLVAGYLALRDGSRG